MGGVYQDRQVRWAFPSAPGGLEIPSPVVCLQLSSQLCFLVQLLYSTQGKPFLILMIVR